MGVLSDFINMGNGNNLLYTMILLPALLAGLILAVPRLNYRLRSMIFMAAVSLNMLFALGVFFGGDMTMLIPWAGFGVNLALRVYDFSALIVLAVAVFALLVGMYSVSFLRSKDYSGRFFFYYLVTVALVNGAVLANNIVVMLFFWEGLLVTLFGIIIIGNREKPKAALKALVLNGIGDLLLMLGVIITATSAGTMMMDGISDLPIEGVGILGFVCMMLGAAGKAGSMPFHSWIPEAATVAPMPFMAILPAALEKMLGIYLLARIALDFYQLQPGTPFSLLVMIIGAVTIVLAVAMALIQKDMKKLLSYHAISQVGYMILGIGTALPVGVVGGLFHMINHVIYKCCLFLTAGSIEKQTGSTDLRKVGGLGKLMPATTVCFIIAACAISGVPPFNGFFSKELVFDAALESGIVYYIAAVLGAFLTAASFLKLGHAAFFGKTKLPEGVSEDKVKENSGAMVTPMLILAGLCIFFGVYNAVPLGQIQPLLGEALGGHDYAGWPHSLTLVVISVAVLLLAAVNHLIGYRLTGEGLKAVDHIHYAPGLHSVYNAAERHYFDPYDIVMLLINAFAWLSYGIDRAINWIYDAAFVNVVNYVSDAAKRINDGHSSTYMKWSFFGVAFIVFLFIILV
ncbi:MAG: proton-conducting transporter membrane subunit [Bacillota bacterium]|nr:proton-conducting transporter membrane subunit [Bacillota bacterium]